MKYITIKTVFGENIPLKVSSLSSIKPSEIITELLDLGYINTIIDLESQISFSKLGIESEDTLSISLYNVNEISKEYFLYDFSNIKCNSTAKVNKFSLIGYDKMCKFRMSCRQSC